MPSTAQYDEPMADNDDNELPQQPEEEYEEPPTGFDELLYAIAEALRSKRSKEAVAALIERYAAEIPVTNKRRHQAMRWSYGFTLLLLAAVGVLGWRGSSGRVAGRPSRCRPGTEGGVV